MKTFGEKLRELREAKGLLLREVGESLRMDTALVSKFERDERIPTKDQVLAFAKFYNISTENLLVAWLSEKIAFELVGEKVAIKAVQLAEQKIRGYKHKH